MPARQGPVRMNNVDWLRTLQVAHLSDDSGEQERPSRGQSKTTGQREIAQPLPRHAGFSSTKFPAVDRLHCKHGVHYAGAPHGVEWLRGERIPSLAVLRRIEMRQS